MRPRRTETMQSLRLASTLLEPKTHQARTIAIPRPSPAVIAAVGRCNSPHGRSAWRRRARLRDGRLGHGFAADATSARRAAMSARPPRAAEWLAATRRAPWPRCQDRRFIRKTHRHCVAIAASDGVARADEGSAAAEISRRQFYLRMCRNARIFGAGVALLFALTPSWCLSFLVFSLRLCVTPLSSMLPSSLPTSVPNTVSACCRRCRRTPALPKFPRLILAGICRQVPLLCGWGSYIGCST